jgi:hypothetical protein
VDEFENKQAEELTETRLLNIQLKEEIRLQESDLTALVRNNQDTKLMIDKYQKLKDKLTASSKKENLNQM